MHLLTNGKAKITIHHGQKSEQNDEITGTLTMHCTEEDSFDRELKSNAAVFKDQCDILAEKWHPYVKKWVEAIRPDIVVADYRVYTGAMVAKEMGIPYIVNVSGPLAMLQENLLFDIPSLKNAKSWCGLVYIRQSCKKSLLQWYKKWSSPYQA